MQVNGDFVGIYIHGDTIVSMTDAVMVSLPV